LELSQIRGGGGWRFDGKLLVSGGGDNKIILWDPKTGERLTTLEGHRLAKLFFFYVFPAHRGRGVEKLTKNLTFEKMAGMVSPASSSTHEMRGSSSVGRGTTQ
jgi:hypothetical protein